MFSAFGRKTRRPSREWMYKRANQNRNQLELKILDKIARNQVENEEIGLQVIRIRCWISLYDLPLC